MDIYYSFDRKHVDSLKKFYIAKIMADCLCATSRSVLSQKFIEKERKLFSIDGDYMINAFDRAFFSISTSFGPNVKMVDIEADIVTAINNFISNTFTPELFEVNKKRILNNIIMLMDNPGDMFNYILENRVNGYTIDDISCVEDIIRSITFEDVRKFAIEILTEVNRTHRIYVHPET
jgi:predicted Zn-dependent peptidase